MKKIVSTMFKCGAVFASINTSVFGGREENKVDGSPTGEDTVSKTQGVSSQTGLKIDFGNGRGDLSVENLPYDGLGIDWGGSNSMG